MNALTKVPILVSFLCYFVGLGDTTTADCVFGTHKSLPGESCRHILHVQPVCFGRSGFYWVKTGSDVDYVYCDMYHKGGGWRRIVFWHGVSASNTTCPGDLRHWIWSGRYYCSRHYWDPQYGYFEWNNNEKVTFSEIRGYFILTVRYRTNTDGFHDVSSNVPEWGHLDGVDIVVGTAPNGHIRNIFAYVVGEIGSSPNTLCPVNGGNEFGQMRRNYRDYDYSCDEFLSTIPLPANWRTKFIVDQEFFVNTTCSMCPAGSPWFEMRYADALQDGRVYIRFVNSDVGLDLILATDFEIYVR